MSKRSFFVSMLSGAICFLNILYLETILGKTKNYELKYCAEYYLGYLAFLKNDTDKSISYLNKYEKT